MRYLSSRVHPPLGAALKRLCRGCEESADTRGDSSLQMRWIESQPAAVNRGNDSRLGLESFFGAGNDLKFLESTEYKNVGSYLTTLRQSKLMQWN